MLSFSKDEWQEWPTCWMSLIPQREKKWHILHIGRITGSSSSVAAGNIRYTEDDLPENVALRLIGKRNINHSDESIRRMNLGKQAEPILRKWYSQERKIEVKEVGLAIWKKDSLIGASADGDIDDGIVEFKYKENMPSTLVYRAKEAYGSISKSFCHISTRDFDQMQHTMGVLGRKYCDYVVLSRKIGIYTETIPFHPDYFELLINRYEQFKEKYLLPAISEHKIQVIPPCQDVIYDTLQNDSQMIN